MDGQEVTQEDLERMALAMAQALSELDCPECCECGVVYQYLERSAEMYREEWEWACLAHILVRCPGSGKLQAQQRPS